MPAPSVPLSANVVPGVAARPSRSPSARVAAASGSEYAASGDEGSSDEESLAAEDSEEESEEDDEGDAFEKRQGAF